MKEYTTIAKLYYLLIHADGKINDKEIQLGKRMIELENLAYSRFEVELEKLDKRNIDDIYGECVSELFKVPREGQINYIAWMCLIANSDGFMDKREWDLIYKLYKKELKLSLEDIMDHQRKLAARINSNSSIIKS